MKQLARARWLAVPALSVLVVSVIWLVVSLLASRPQKFTDSDLVYCLSDQQRESLVRAAEALGLADAGTAGRVRVGGEELDPDQWRSSHEADFRRSCLALNPPRPTAQPGVIQSGLTAVFGAVVGGAIAYVSAKSRDRMLRREQDAKTLNSATAAFIAAVENYVRARGAPVPPNPLNVDEVRARRNELAAELRLVRARHPGWTGPDAPLAMLGAELSERLTGNWTDKAARAAELTGHLDRLATLVSDLAVELERGQHR